MAIRPRPTVVKKTVQQKIQALGIKWSDDPLVGSDLAMGRGVDRHGSFGRKLGCGRHLDHKRQN